MAAGDARGREGLEQMNYEALCYLKAPADGLWRWEDGDSIAWHDGSTITFRQELAPLLEWRGHPTLPPLDIVVLVLAALRGKVPEAEDLWRPRGAIDGPEKVIHSKAIQALEQRMRETVGALERVRRLPRELVQRPMAKLALIELVAEALEAHPKDRSEIGAMLEYPIHDWGELNPDLPGEADHIPAAHVLHRALGNLDQEKLAIRIAAGCDKLIAPADFDFSSAVQSLIGELQHDREMGPIARLTRDIMAAIYLPRRLSEEEELPIGGAADLSNRGSLDRLLLSELAHEDAVLAARIALNEALYLKREPPMQPAAASFAVLLDAGVRMWGNARLFGIAASLALIAHTPKRSGAAFVTDRIGMKVADYSTRSGLLRVMETLSPHHEPGSALDTFLKETAGLENAQRALVTHRDVAGDPDFRLQLQNLPEPILVAVVEETGEFKLFYSDRLSGDPICGARVDLSEIATPVPKHRPGVSSEPAIYRCHPFPILLPVNGSIAAFTELGPGNFAVVTENRRIYCTYGPRSGARLALDPAPAGKVLVLEYIRSLSAVVLITSAWEDGSIPMVTFDVESGRVRRSQLRVRARPISAWIRGEYLFIYSDKHVEIINIRSGELNYSQSLNLLDDVEWHRGRYFFSLSGWDMLSYDGLTWSLQRIISGPHDVTEVFDRQREEGPWVIRKLGIAQSLEEYRRKLHSGIAIPGTVTAISKDGERVCLNNNSVFDLRARRFATFLEPTPKAASITMRIRWQSIGASAEGNLMLHSFKGKWVELVPDRLGLILRNSLELGRRVRQFQLAQDAYGVAEWPTGARAVIDHHGLLHLQYDSPDFSETTIALCEGLVPIWISTGETTGPKRMTGKEPNIASRELRQNIRRFVNALRLS